MMEAHWEDKKEKEHDKHEMQKLDAVAEADIAQIVRAIQVSHCEHLASSLASVHRLIHSHWCHPFCQMWRL